MTGNEFYVISPDYKSICLMKVRHDGYDFEDYIKTPGIFEIPFEKWAEEYFNWRLKNWDMTEEKEKEYGIDSAYKKTGVFLHDLDKSVSEMENLIENFDDFFDEFNPRFEAYLEKMENIHQEMNPAYYEGFLCGYGGGWIVDLRQKEIINPYEKEDGLPYSSFSSSEETEILPQGTFSNGISSFEKHQKIVFDEMQILSKVAELLSQGISTEKILEKLNEI